MTEEGYLLPQIENWMARWDKPITYSVAQKQLKKEIEDLGLQNITLHLGRVGAAMGAVKMVISRNVIKKGGNWRSNAVDTYMQVSDPGVEIGDRLLERF